jgi:uncharacterized membrane protein YfcA
MAFLTDPFFVLVAVAAVLIAGVSKGGFGGGLVVLAVPLMALSTGPVTAAAILLPVLCVMDLLGLRAFWRRWDRGLIRLLIPPALAGVAVGTLSFRYLGEDWIRLLIGLIATAFSLRYWHSGRRRGARSPDRRQGRFWSGIAGFTGFVAHSGGPPLNVYLLPLGLERTVYQATTVAYFAIINYVKLLPYAWLGQLSAENLAVSLVLLPLAFAGVRLGVHLHHRISETTFYTVAYLLLFLTGARLIYDGLGGLLA